MSKILPISGFPEWSPSIQMLQERFLDVIRKNFRAYGYCVIDTPSVERIESLSSKGGGENEKEIYALRRLFGEATDDASLALRFDLTVPMARYVAQNEHNLAFPFLRSAIGKVWRGERAQSGRFREFYQCDIDVIGNGVLSLDYDAQVPATMYNIFSEFEIGDVVVRVNNRKILQGFMLGLNVPSSRHNSLLTLVDKIEKIGKDEVARQSTELGLSEAAVEKLITFLSLPVPLDGIKNVLLPLSHEELYKTGVTELDYVVSMMRNFGIPDHAIIVDMSIARGLDYYTGTVYETNLVEHPEIGSVCSGGRYENLVENFSNKKFPGVGMSIGLTRLIARLIEFKIVNPQEQSFAKVLLVNVSEKEMQIITQIALRLRKAGIACEQYLSSSKLDKQIAYAVKKGYQYLVIVGGDETSRNVVRVKNLKTRSQAEVPFDQLIDFFK